MRIIRARSAWHNNASWSAFFTRFDCLLMNCCVFHFYRVRCIMKFLALNTDMIKSVGGEGNWMKITFPSIERNLWLYFRFEHSAFIGSTRPFWGLPIHYESPASNFTPRLHLSLDIYSSSSIFIFASDCGSQPWYLTIKERAPTPT